MADSWWWDALVAGWYPGDEFRPTPEVQRYYEIKHQIVQELQPASILEIGVRAGYSAFAFLTARPDADYLGVDNGLCDREIVRGRHPGSLLGHARTLLAPFKGATVLEADSQTWLTLPVTASLRPYEFVHVDAQHDLKGCLQDLFLAQQYATWILVDDYDVGPEIREACSRAFDTAYEWKRVHVDDGYRGSLLLLRHGKSRNWLTVGEDA